MKCQTTDVRFEGLSRLSSLFSRLTTTRSLKIVLQPDAADQKIGVSCKRRSGIGFFIRRRFKRPFPDKCTYEIKFTGYGIPDSRRYGRAKRAILVYISCTYIYFNKPSSHIITKAMYHVAGNSKIETVAAR